MGKKPPPLPPKKKQRAKPPPLRRRAKQKLPPEGAVTSEFSPAKPPGAADDESRPTMEHPSLSSLPTLAQSLQEMVNTLDRCRQELQAGSSRGVAEALRSCNKAEKLLEIAATSEEYHDVRGHLIKVLLSVRTQLDK